MVHHRENSRRIQRRRRGATVVFFAVLLVVIIGMIALAVDTGVMMLTRSEIQRSADSAVLAAAGILSEGDKTEQEVVAEAIEFLSSNGIDPDELDEDELTIEFGTWDSENHTFATGSFGEASAIRVAVDMSGNGLFFGAVLGLSTFDVSAEAIAITSASNVERDIMLVLDCSGSMDNDNDDPEQPMTAVKDGSKLLCDVVNSDDRVGLTVYNWENDDDHETGHVEVGLTHTVQFVKTRINDLEAKFYEGGTNGAGGLHIGGESLYTDAREGVQKELILLTDGRFNDKEPPYTQGNADHSATEWANHLRTQWGIIVHTIGVGDRVDEDVLEEAAGGDLPESDPLKGLCFIVDGDIEEYTEALADAFEELGNGTQSVALVR
jgi:Flp pilus assembly protein TadG